MPISRIGTDGIEAGAVTADDLADGAVTSAKMATAVQPIGVGQTWQNVAASRALDTTYTNNTGRPISVALSITGFNGGTRSSVFVVIDGITTGQAYTNDYYTASAITPSIVYIPVIVPAGSTYRFTTGGTTAQTVTYWFELR